MISTPACLRYSFVKKALFGKINLLSIEDFRLMVTKKTRICQSLHCVAHSCSEMRLAANARTSRWRVYVVAEEMPRAHQTSHEARTKNSGATHVILSHSKSGVVWRAHELSSRVHWHDGLPTSPRSQCSFLGKFMQFMQEK